MTILVAVADDPMRDRVLDVALDLGRGLDHDLYVLHLVDGASADTEARRLRDEVREYVAVAATAASATYSRTSSRRRRASVSADAPSTRWRT